VRRTKQWRAVVGELASGVLLLAVVFLVGQFVTGEKQQGAPPQVEEPLSVSVTVDATRPTEAAAEIAGDEWWNGIAPSTALVRAGWLTLKGRILPFACDSDAVMVAAIRTHDGAAVGVHNRTPQPVSLRLGIILPQASYSAQRAVRSGDSITVEALQSVRTAKAAPAYKPGLIPAGGSVIYRFINPLVRAADAYRSASAEIAGLRSGHPTQYRRLKDAIKECPWLLTQAQKLASLPNPDPAVSHIHRALLCVRHAQALTTNGVGLGRIPRAAGQRIAGGLDELEDALGDASAAVLGLVATAALSIDAEPTATRYHVTVSLRNAGSKTIRAVRLWAAGDENTVVEPSDAAVFPTLHPGQTVTANFQVHLPEGAADFPIYGFVGYMAHGAPARLRQECY